MQIDPHELLGDVPEGLGGTIGEHGGVGG